MYLSNSHRNITEKVIQMRNSNGKGVTATVATVLMLGMTVAGAGTYYTVQQGIIDDVRDQEYEYFTDTRITVESCWSNQTSTYVTVRNDNEDYGLNTATVSTYTQGERLDSDPDKDYVDPLRTFNVKLERHLENNVPITVYNSGYQTEITCEDHIQPLEAEFSYSPTRVTTSDVVDFEDRSEGIITDYTWKKGTTTLGNSETETYQFTSQGDKEMSLTVEDVLGNTDTETKNLKVQNIQFQINSYNHNAPIEEGEKFQLDYEIQNYGSITGTQDIKLMIDGKTEDSQTKNLNPDESITGTLEWQTTTGDAGSHSYKIKTENDERTGNFQVTAVLPEAVADYNPSPANTGTTITLDGSNSNYGTTSGSITGYDWIVTNTNGNTVTTGTGETFDITGGFSAEGKYTAELKISTNTGRTDTDISQIEVNEPTTESSLTADFTYNPNPLMPGETANLDASPSTAPDGTITTYQWDTVDDGIWDKTGLNTQKTFGSAGLYPITLKVTSSTGETDQITKQIDVGLAYVVEKGGSGNAEIGTLTVPGAAEIRGPDSPTGSNICLGVDCPDTTGSETSLDSDQYVNESGDRMDGTLYTDGFSSGGDICIGTDCLPVSATDGPGLSTGNQDTQSDFRLEVPAIRPNSDNNICLGTDC